VRNYEDAGELLKETFRVSERLVRPVCLTPGRVTVAMPVAAADPPVLLDRRRVNDVDRLRGLFRFAKPR